MDQHWVYPAAPHQTWTPPQTRGLKRGISESDCDDAYSEESSKEHTSPGDSDSCQLISRKKRRGVIEKKRRDKINSSLSELKRLVPSCYEKQGSAKLEKAEILQMTVDHLKNLHAKGNDFYSLDHQKFALDYHITGFRECISEVARYLATIEGMDMQNPLRLRLMSHLQCFMTQRELSARSNPSLISSSYPACPPPPIPLYQQTYSNQNVVTASHSNSSISTPTRSYTSDAETLNSPTSSYLPKQTSHLQHATGSIAYGPITEIAPHPGPHVEHHHGSTYLDLSNSRSHPNLYGNAPFSGAETYPTNSVYNNSSSKPHYRPWGTEMAY